LINPQGKAPLDMASSMTDEEIDTIFANDRFFHDMVVDGVRTKSFIYDDAMPPNYHLFPVFDYLKELDLSAASCLDIGTFDGMTAFVMHKMGARAVHASCQYDLPRFRAVRARLGAANIAYYPRTDYKDFERLFDRSTFDLTVVSAMLHHVLAPLDFFFEVRRLTKRGGYFILESIVSADQDPTLSLNTMLANPVFGAPTIWIPSLSALRGMLQLACFEIVSETRLLGGRRARETNYDRITFLCRASSPGEMPERTEKTKEIQQLPRLGPLDFRALDNKSGPEADITTRHPLGAGKTAPRRLLNIWEHRESYPLQPQWHDPAPAAECQHRIGTEPDFRRLVNANPDGAFTVKDLQLFPARYPGEQMPDGMQWGLKQLGNIFVLDHVRKWGLHKVCEIGPGFNFYFPNHIPDYCDYVALDTPGFYESEIFALMKKRLPRGRMVDGMLGATQSIPDESFDACISVSVLEHIPHQQIENAARDMYRLLEPGGWAVHSLDVLAGQVTATPVQWFNALKNAGFLLPDKPDVAIPELGSKDPPLLEPLSIVARFATGYKADVWKQNSMTGPNPMSMTVLIAARKPPRATS